MRTTILIGLAVVIVSSATAQFRVLPQVGLENSTTKLSYNDLSSFTPLKGQLSPHASLRFEYQFKKGHGPYLGIGTSQSAITYSFSDLESGMHSFLASRNNVQLRFEGGYKLSTKPILFNKSQSTSSSKSKNSSSVAGKTGAKKGCGSAAAKSHCGSSAAKSHCGSKGTSAKSTNKGTWMKIQPSLGFAYVPSNRSDDIVLKNQRYQYNAGNFNTALVAGTGFEFGKKNNVGFVVSVNYVKGLGNMDERTVTSVIGNKTTSATLESSASAWNVRVGIPLALKKSGSRDKKERYRKEEKRCGEYKIIYRCTKKI